MESPIFPLDPLDKLLLDCLHQDENRQKAIHAASLNAGQWNAFVHTPYDKMSPHCQGTHRKLLTFPKIFFKSIISINRGNALLKLIQVHFF